MNFPIPGDLNFRKYCIEKYGSIENLKYKAKNGEIIAQADLGVAYSEGLGDELPKDTDKAIGWLNTAVEKGYEIPSFLGKLGELLDRKGTLPHQRKAYQMYHRAAKLGSTTSQLNLAELYRCGVKGVVNEDLNEAFKWYKKAADEDLSDANSDLEPLYKLFVGTVKKLKNAVDDSKQRALASLYEYYLIGDCPEGRPQPTKAVYYLTRAAELGDTEAQLKLGRIYLTGSCGPRENMKDVARARRWLGKAAGSGDETAKQLLQECEHSDTSQDDASICKDDVLQALDIQSEKQRQRSEANLHPFAIPEPVAFSEEMFSQFHWSKTARIYLQAFKLVKEGLEILYKSNFTNGKGISLIARGFLTENSILQGFPFERSILRPLFQLCERNLKKNPSFFEGHVVSLALHHFERNLSVESSKVDLKKIMCIKNVIDLIQKAEADSIPPADPFTFDKNYSSWLHVLYFHLGAIYSITNDNEKAAEAFDNSLKYCPSYFDSKRGLGYSLMWMYLSRRYSGDKESSESVPNTLPSFQKAEERKISKFASWTNEELGDTAERILKEFLVESPFCWKTYPNGCYYLAKLALANNKMNEFKKYYELGQDAEEKRPSFLRPLHLPLKDGMCAAYQLSASVRDSVRCGNSACIKKVEERDLKTCGGCGHQKYCSKECQIADWKNHKASCSAKRKKDGGT